MKKRDYKGWEVEKGGERGHFYCIRGKKYEFWKRGGCKNIKYFYNIYPWLRIQTILHRIRFSKFRILLESDLISKNLRIFFLEFLFLSKMIQDFYSSLLLENLGMIYWSFCHLVDVFLFKDPDPGSRKVPDPHMILVIIICFKMIYFMWAQYYVNQITNNWLIL